MYLSQIKLAPEKLYNPYEWHKHIWTLFPGIEREPGEAAPFLFRMKAVGLSSKALIQSHKEPIPSSDYAEVLRSKYLDIAKLEMNLKPDMALHFHLVANPTKMIRDAKNRDKKLRVPLIHHNHQIKWLKRKFKNAAYFETTCIQAYTNHALTFYKGKKSQNSDRKKGKIVSVTYDGILHVQNAEKFIELVKWGVGRGKAFGCGLLSIART